MRFVFPSPVGCLEARIDGDALIGLSYTDKPISPVPRHGLAQDLLRQLKRYFFRDSKHCFQVRLELHGTAFQKRVWRVLQSIPPGSVLSYGDIAERLHSGPRAVGNACGHNPVSIIVPCHRVLAAGGMGGYTGGAAAYDPLHLKAWLLGHENAPIRCKAVYNSRYAAP